MGEIGRVILRGLAQVKIYMDKMSLTLLPPKKKGGENILNGSKSPFEGTHMKLGDKRGPKGELICTRRHREYTTLGI
jgi:hypothetical protein